jgi:hypothetical protein
MPDQPPGPLLPDDRILTLRDAARHVAQDDPERLARSEKALDSLVQPLAILADLAQDSKEAIGGSSSAVDRLTTALALVAGRVPATERTSAVTELERRDGLGGEPGLPDSGRDLLNHDDIGLIGLAAAYASVARPEAAELIGRGVRQTLDLLMSLDLLWALTPGVLEDDPRSVRLFASALDWLAERGKPIGPDDPRLPEIPDILNVIPFDRRQLLDRVRCVSHGFERLRQLPLVAPYVISSITPISACPGQTVVIGGSGFGAQAQSVLFATVGGTAGGQVTTWTDTTIEVVVPPDTTCGDIQLLIPVGTTTTCTGQAVDVYKPGSGNVHFDGGVPVINWFTGNGKATRVRVDPGSTLEFAWQACPSSATVVLKIREADAWNVVTTTATGLSASGRYTHAVPPGTTPMTIEGTLEVSNTCLPTPVQAKITADVAPMPNVKIEGIEVTQGIQTFWRTGVTDNSVSTVAGKDTIVRVYISADMGGFNNDEVPKIWGTLSIGSTNLYPINGITPANPNGGTPFLTARKRSAITRGNLNHTLNFRIPAALSTGTRSLFAYLIVPGPGGTVDQIVSKLMNWTWVTEPRVKVRYVRIRDEHDPMNIVAEPTDAQCRETVLRAIDMLPFPPDAAPALFANHTTTRDFTIDAQGSAMVTDIGNLRSAAEVLGSFGYITFDKEERWIGLTVPWFRGWGGWKVCVTPVSNAASGGERLRAAHELGHTLGLCHMHDTACFQGAGLTAEPTLDDTAVDPYYNRAIAGTGHDFMSYTTWSDNWTSKVNWEALRAVL